MQEPGRDLKQLAGKAEELLRSSHLDLYLANVPERQIVPLRDIILRFLNGKKKIVAADPSKPITIPTNLHSMMRFLNNCGDLSESQDTKANPKSLSKRKPWGANIFWGQSKLLAITHGCFLLFWVPLILKPRDGLLIPLVPPVHRSSSFSAACSPAPTGRSAGCLFPCPSQVKGRWEWLRPSPCMFLL